MWTCCVTCYMKPICEQCLFYVDNLEEKPVCSNYKNKKDYDLYIQYYMDFLSRNPEIYERIMKELY